LALFAGAGVWFAVEGLVGAGAGVDEGAEEFGVLVGEVAAELNASVGAGQGQRLAGEGLVFFGLWSVRVEYVADALTGSAELERGQMAGQADQFTLGDGDILGRDL
jgi:hypothetical protein